MRRQVFLWLPVLLLMSSSTAFAADKRPRQGNQEASLAPPFDATDRYETRTVEGWKVMVNHRLRDGEPALHAEALKLMEHQLYDVARRAPVSAVAKLRKVPIWLELNDPHHRCAVYHPDVQWLRENGMNPDKARCVEIANARTFLQWTKNQPMMLLHELAHAYHDQFLEGGHGNADVRRAYENARQSKIYENVLRGSSKTERHYAMNNPMEYFAEASEAYFGTNDYFPFVAAELRIHDQRMYDLMSKLWSAQERTASRSIND